MIFNMEAWFSNTTDWMQILVLLLLSVSLVLQFCAAFFALHMIRLSERRLAWMLLASALLLMGLRRAITFYYLFNGMSAVRPHLAAELVAFLISLLLLAGLLTVSSTLRRMSRGHAAFEACNTVACGLFQNLPCGVAVFKAMDAKGREFIIEDVNPAVERIEHMARAHIINRPLREVFPGVDDFGLPEVLHRVWKSGSPELFPLRHYEDNRISGWRDTAVYRRPDRRVVAVYSDVTAQMHMQQELERREHRFRVLYEQSPVPVLTLDSDGRMIEFNPAWEAVCGRLRDDLIERNFSELLTRDSRRVFNGLQGNLRGGTAVAQSVLTFRETGHGSLETNVKLLRTPGGIGTGDHILVLLSAEPTASHTPSRETDFEKAVQERAGQMIEAERRAGRMQKFEQLGELTEGIAQELNAPLGSARDAINLLRINMGPDARFTDFADTAERELRRIGELIERMYRFYEPVPTEREPLSINAMIDNTLALLRKSVQTHGVQILDERDASVPKAELPPAAVMAVLINLMRNAVEVLPEGGTLTLRSGAAAGGGVWIEMEDDGPGIPPDFMPHLYEPFATFHHEGAHPRGIGLGMAIVRRTIDVLGGDIAVESKVGEGTTVRVEFPAASVSPFH